MTLEQKREIVRRFMDGQSLFIIDWRRRGIDDDEAEDVLRDFINGKFTLDTKKGKR